MLRVKGGGGEGARRGQKGAEGGRRRQKGGMGKQKESIGEQKGSIREQDIEMVLSAGAKQHYLAQQEIM